LFCCTDSSQAGEVEKKGGDCRQYGKIVTEAFKNKQVETFRKYLGAGVRRLDAEASKMSMPSLPRCQNMMCVRNSFADMKLAIPQ